MKGSAASLAKLSGQLHLTTLEEEHGKRIMVIMGHFLTLGGHHIGKVDKFVEEMMQLSSDTILPQIYEATSVKEKESILNKAFEF